MQVNNSYIIHTSLYKSDTDYFQNFNVEIGLHTLSKNLFFYL